MTSIANVDLRLLRIFTTIVKCGGFSAAHPFDDLAGSGRYGPRHWQRGMPLTTIETTFLVDICSQSCNIFLALRQPNVRVRWQMSLAGQ